MWVGARQFVRAAYYPSGSRSIAEWTIVMVNLVYASTAVKQFSADELTELLRRSREKNGRLGITGLLLYKRGEFMQALEGEEASVRALYSIIRVDPRHRNVITLVDVPVAQRRFSDWTMGFENLDEADFDNGSVEATAVKLPPKVGFPWRGSVALQFLAGFWGARLDG